jgi:hypothetical protein
LRHFGRLANVTPLSFSFSDGVQTIANTTPGVVSGFYFSTDPLGSISAWYIFVTSGSNEITTTNDANSVEDYGNEPAPYPLTPVGENLNLASTWVPLPAALPLFATGLGVMGLLGWRRKRKDVAAIAGLI